MKVDKERLLERLLAADDYIPFEEFTEAFDCSRRTLYRYINEINEQYKSRHMYVETKYGKGIKLAGSTDAVPFDTVYSAKVRFIDFTPERRQLAELLYYSVRMEEVKTSALAGLLNVSHSTVDGDVAVVEQTVLRMPEFKGIRLFTTHYGRGMSAPLWSRRMLALYVAAQLFPVPKSGRIFLGRRESAEYKQFKALLSLPASHADILECLRTAERSMQCSFSLYDSVLLYFYLALSAAAPCTERCRESDIPESLKKLTGFDPRLEPSVPDRTAARILRLLQVDSPVERYLLRTVLSALAPVRFSETACVDQHVQNCIREAEIQLFQQYLLSSPLQKDLKVYLGVELSAVLYKKVYGIPKDTSDYVPVASGMVAGGAQHIESISQNMLEAMNPLLKAYCGCTLTGRDIAPLCIAVSTEHSHRQTVTAGLRVLVICFEGICLSRMIASQLRMYFPELEIVNMTGIEALTETYLEENGIDVLVTSALPERPASVPVPCYEIPESGDRLELLDGFRQFLEDNAARLGRGCMDNSQAGACAALSEPAVPAVPAADPVPEQHSAGGQNEALHAVFSHFTILELDKPLRRGKITAKLASVVLEDAESRKKLQKAFDVRERKGHVYLRVENIQLFHCRCECVSAAQAGLLRCAKDGSVILYLIAPAQASKDELFALSLISSALIEADEFAQALHTKSAPELESILQKLIG